MRMQSMRLPKGAFALIFDCLSDGEMEAADNLKTFARAAGAKAWFITTSDVSMDREVLMTWPELLAAARTRSGDIGSEAKAAPRSAGGRAGTSSAASDT